VSEIDADAVLELVETRGQWEYTLVEFIDVVAAALNDRRAAVTAVMALAELHGGHVFYLPKGDRLRNAIRDLEIVEAHERQGLPVEALARRYGLCAMRIRQIILRAQRLRFQQGQGNLFG
jgi:Mor family transcriptional regulator